ncbi:MAG: FAD/NAD(P)-binding oxidoreductase, partial [Tepidisphaeraceae bacterium]
MPDTFDIAIIGAGPAGLAAAWAATQAGFTVCIIDENPAPGGQIWRGESSQPTSADSKLWLARFAQLKCARLLDTTVIAQPEPGVLLAEQAGRPVEIRYRKLILATGARERFLPFPGWTSPRILGVGGIQAMVKSGLNVAGKRIIVAGSGPLLLPAAATLRSHGATIQCIVEQTPLKTLVRFGLSLLTSLGKLRQAASLKWQTLDIPYHAGAWPTHAYDTGHELQVKIATRSGPIIQHCDCLACGFFLVPQLELPRLLDCAVNSGCVTVNELQQSSVPDIFCAGETTGIGGLEKSLIEGHIAGHAAAGNVPAAQLLFGPRRKSRRFAAQLGSAFELRPELKTLADDNTIVCRCEDVRLGDLRPFTTFRN